MNWLPIRSIEDWELLLNENAKAQQQVVAVFKHSTRCSISAMAKNRLESDWERYNSDLPIYYLDLIAHRDVSNAIAERTNVRHESPQIILLQEGKAIYHASHISISSKSVAKHK